MPQTFAKVLTGFPSQRPISPTIILYVSTRGRKSDFQTRLSGGEKKLTVSIAARAPWRRNYACDYASLRCAARKGYLGERRAFEKFLMHQLGSITLSSNRCKFRRYSLNFFFQTFSLMIQLRREEVVKGYNRLRGFSGLIKFLFQCFF